MNKFSKEWQNRNGKVFLWPWENRRTQNSRNCYVKVIFDALEKLVNPLMNFIKWTKKSFSVTVLKLIFNCQDNL